uniref:GRIP domain-containing protein n=1 Tax=Strongyloides papillosus TaxID=174720 RepID=A0A0N5B3F0_STREA
MSSRRHILEKAVAKKRHNQDLSKIRSISLKYSNSQRRITYLTEKIDALSQENRSIEEQYSNLLQNNEKLLEEISQLKRQHEESMMRAREAEIHCDNLNRINFNLNQICQQQARQNNIMSGSKDKELSDANSKLKYMLENSVLLSIQKKQLQYCCPSTQQKWINSIISAIVRTNINEAPPSDVLIKLSDRIMKLANETMRKEKERERKAIMLKEKETKVTQIVEMELSSSNTNDQIKEIEPSTVNKENQKSATSFSNLNEGDSSVKMPSQQQKERKRLFAIPLLDGNDSTFKGEASSHKEDDGDNMRM